MKGERWLAQIVFVSINCICDRCWLRPWQRSGFEFLPQLVAKWLDRNAHSGQLSLSLSLYLSLSTSLYLSWRTVFVMLVVPCDLLIELWAILSFSHSCWISGWPIVTTLAERLNRAESSQIWSFKHFKASSRESWKHATRSLDHFSTGWNMRITHLHGRKELVRRSAFDFGTQGFPEYGPKNLVGMPLASDVGGLILAGMRASTGAQTLCSWRYINTCRAQVQGLRVPWSGHDACRIYIGSSVSQLHLDAACCIYSNISGKLVTILWTWLTGLVVQYVSMYDLMHDLAARACSTKYEGRVRTCAKGVLVQDMWAEYELVARVTRVVMVCMSRNRCRTAACTYVNRCTYSNLCTFVNPDLPRTVCLFVCDAAAFCPS